MARSTRSARRPASKHGSCGSVACGPPGVPTWKETGSLRRGPAARAKAQSAARGCPASGRLSISSIGPAWPWRRRSRWLNPQRGHRLAVRHTGAMSIHITGDEAADRVLADDPFALPLGMLLDQQYPMEHAFRGPAKVLDRFGTLEPRAIADADPEQFAALCATPPAVHRFPGSMAARIQAVARVVVETYGGDTARLWTEAASGPDLVRRVMALPGFGRQKA